MHRRRRQTGDEDRRRGTNMNVTVVGRGRVGLTAAVYLALAGHRVTGVESKSTRCLRGPDPLV